MFIEKTLKIKINDPEGVKYNSVNRVFVARDEVRFEY